MKVLIATIGLPRSGKSTWAMEQNLPVVSPDAIRLALHGEQFISSAEPMVWAMSEYMVKALFLAGHDKVVLDSTSITESRRQPWKKLCNDMGVEYTYVIIPTKADICIKRALELENYELVSVIERMAKETDIEEIKEEVEDGDRN